MVTITMTITLIVTIGELLVIALLKNLCLYPHQMELGITFSSCLSSLLI